MVFSVSRRRLIVIGVSLLLGGCGLFLGLETPVFDPDSPAEASTEDDGASSDLDASSRNDALTDGGGVIGTDGAPLNAPERWSSWADAGGAGGFLSGPFDGRYVYFIRGRDPDGIPDSGLTPSQPPARILRLDTTADFANDAAWSVFDPQNRFPTIGNQFAASLDGRFLIVASFQTNHFLRFDTANAAGFGTAALWELFDSSAVAVNANTYGAAADLNGSTYFVPSFGAHPILRHSNMEILSSFIDWTARAITDAGAPLGCPWARGAACVGNYIYFGPSPVATNGDCFVRFDSTKSITLNTAWEPFQISDLSPSFHELHGIIATPTHIYLTRATNASGVGGGPFQILRKTATDPMDAGWEVQTSNVRDINATGNVGGVFDGRFIYFSPSPTNGNTIYTRYDTTRPFNDTGAWDSIGHQAINVPPTSHQGATFDGQYIYFPAWNVVGSNKFAAMVRFRAYDAKVPVPVRCSAQ
jgi:hypothetical protein